ncbi:MAG: heparinase II/III family protein [Gammaproteobacteria bacterium]|nr:heparinase II/III family protein [Gammaproteobacteria bacterium]
MLRRILRMDAHEIYIRALQEFRKRFDVIASVVGRPFGSDRSPGYDLIPSSFFFEPTDTASIVQLLKERLPEQVTATITSANEICEHRFDLLGYKGLSFGDEIDWHFDPVNDIRTPKIAWYRLEKSDVSPGDRKVIWELNRHQHLVTLAKAFLLTQDQKYVSELVDQWKNWQSANRYPLGINWSSSLEVAFRGVSWLWVDMLLRNQGGVPNDWIEQMRAAQLQNIRHISRYLSTYSGPNTHLLGEAVALFLICKCYPDLPGATRLADSSLKVIEEQALKQVRDDGFYFEQSTHYHVYALDFLLHFVLLAERHNIDLQPSTKMVVKKMCDALAKISQSTIAFRIGDDDGGRVFDPRRNENSHLLDPLVVGSMLFSYSGWKSLTDGLTEESIWLLGSHGCDIFSSLPCSELESASVRLSDSGICIMAASCDSRWQLGIDAGPQGIGNSGHGHADALSVQLSNESGAWLVDSGTCSYSDNVQRDRFRETAAHNTVEVDGSSQSVPVHAFAWAQLPQTDVTHWSTNDEWDYFRGQHDGYARLDSPVTHTRRVARIGVTWVILDEVVGAAPGTEVSLRWHFAPGLQLQALGNNRFCANNVRSDTLGIIFATEKGQDIALEKTSISEVYGATTSSRVLRCTTHNGSTQRFLSVLAPDKTNLSVSQVTCEQAVAYDLQDESSTTRLIFGDGKATWTCGDMIGDEEFSLLRLSSNADWNVVAQLDA